MKNAILVILTVGILTACGDHQQPAAYQQPVVIQQPAHQVQPDNTMANFATGAIIGSMMSSGRGQPQIIERQTTIIREVPASTVAPAPIAAATAVKPAYAPPVPVAITPAQAKPSYSSPAPAPAKPTYTVIQPTISPAPVAKLPPVPAKAFVPSTTYVQAKPTVTYKFAPAPAKK